MQGQLAAPLQHANLRNLAAGRLLMYFANAMAPIVLAFTVLDLTHSSTDLGMIVGARSIANVALVLLGGVIADRISRAAALQGSALAACLVQGAIAVSALFDLLSIPLLVVLSVANGAVAALSLPASAALIPQTVPKEELRAANAVTRMATNLGMIVGASAGGVLVGWVGPGWGLACNSAAFLGASLCYFRVRLGPIGTAEERAHPVEELRDGWKEFTARSWVWMVVFQCMLVNAAVAGGVQVLGPLIADTTFGRSMWGFMLGAQTFGALIGGFVAARARVRRALFVGVAVSAFDAVPLAMLAGAPQVMLLTVAMFLNGMAMEQFGVAWDLSLQENISHERLARVYSYDALGSFVALPVGEVGAGFAADHIGIRTSLLVASVVVLVATLAAIANRGVRTLSVESAQEVSPRG